MIEFLDYDLYSKRLDNLLNSNFKYKIIKHKPIAFTSCGFPVEHYSIGSGIKHFIVMGGTHGTEIISIDFVTKLMEVLAKGICDISEFTIHFIPCQNPEGFIAVTESLKPYISQDLENISKEYYHNFRKDDLKVLGINKLFKELGFIDKIDDFWNEYRFKDISKDSICSFLDDRGLEYDSNIIDNFMIIGKELFIDGKIPKDSFRHKMFKGVAISNIITKDARYKLLKDKITKIMNEEYAGYKYPDVSIIDYRANSNGVDLNKNNPINFEYNLKFKDQYLFGNMRYYNLLRDKKGPQGVSSKNFDKFEFEEENKGLLKLLDYLYKKGLYSGMISYHGTGGVIYARPKNPENAKDENEYKRLIEIDVFNNKIANFYSSFTDYEVLDYEENPIGTGDMIRSKYKGFLLVELSKMGGNPLGPYGDFDNYKKIINDNIKAFLGVLKLVVKLDFKVEE